MPKREEIKKVLVIGSGPIVIGQAAEFDYAGAQACLSLREEGVETVLINSNPATIMTDSDIADRIYIEPMTVEVIDQILEREKPQGVLPTLGGQTGLNLGMKLAKEGILAKHGCELLGTPMDTIYKAEDRQAFKNLMQEIGEPIPASVIATNLDEANVLKMEIGLPLIIRPAYTLGGTGGGIATSDAEFAEIVHRGLESSPIHQILVEQYIGGMKEIEFEVMRDSGDNCITICSMENFDPVGIHTGDSVVVAPCQTLTDREYQMMRSASINIIRALGVEGGCNVQFALDTLSFQYYVIEVNPRVSRSSALASKATGYPIARIAAKIAIGMQLDEIPNAITKKTVAAFEPAIDYCVLKIPRFPFDKFPEGDRSLGSQMKATGEVMSIDRTFEGAVKKALRSMDTKPNLDEWLKHDKYWAKATDVRLSLIIAALRRGITVETINADTQIDLWFLRKLRNLVTMEEQLAKLAALKDEEKNLQLEALLKRAKQFGFADHEIVALTDVTDTQLKQLLGTMHCAPTFKMVDTCAGEFEAVTPYFYSTWEDENEAVPSGKQDKAIVIGSGPIRIGQGIEFDYCSVHASLALREMGIESIMINNNPETVSTDFDVSDRLYFEPLELEDVVNVYNNESVGLDDGKKPKFIVQFGGQTSLTVASQLAKAGVIPHAGQVDSIELASNRGRFEKLLMALNIPFPRGHAAKTAAEALIVAEEIGFPVLVRPSFVLGGRAMEIVYSLDHMRELIDYVFSVVPDAPVLVDKYIDGKEAEVDLLFDGSDVLIPGIMEHIERAGIHSGDSMAVYPTQGLTLEQIDKMVDYSMRLAKAVGNIGLTNIQFVLQGGDVFVIEANPRGSRTVPFLSKVTGIPMVKLATQLLYGAKLKDLGYFPGLYPSSGVVAVKAPVFSFAKLTNVRTKLGPEMKSTGEVMGIDRTYPNALRKAFIASGIQIPLEGKVFVTVANRDKEEALSIVRGFAELGYAIVATEGTAHFLSEHEIKAAVVGKISDDPKNSILKQIKNKHIQLVINTPEASKDAESDGPQIRTAAIQYGVPCLTSLDTARALLFSLRARRQGKDLKVRTMAEYLES